MSEARAKAPRDVPWAAILACVTLLCGCALAIGGMYVLAGLGWALVGAAVPFLLFAAVIIRGLTRG